MYCVYLWFRMDYFILFYFFEINKLFVNMPQARRPDSKNTSFDWDYLKGFQELKYIIYRITITILTF